MKIDDLILVLEEFRENLGNVNIVISINDDTEYDFDEDDFSQGLDLETREEYLSIEVETNEDYE